VALNDDDVNIFTTLMARNLNPSLRILARANEPASVDKLYRAGADYVALLPAIGGQVIASIILSDRVAVLLDLPDRQKVVMKHVMRHVPTSVGEVERRSGATVLGIERPGESIVRPATTTSVREGDALVVLGRNETLKRFINQY
ncbi:MAG TPA: NAD-binding protein, partial [Methanomicrobiales archaeon]|nr:NAD-binding protein [Methanomicrobiales archaeon]